MNCNDGIIGSFIYIFKNILNIIWIAGPILSILSLTINITILAKDPDEKKTIKKIKYSVIALVILFFIHNGIYSTSIIPRHNIGISFISFLINNASSSVATAR